MNDEVTAGLWQEIRELKRQLEDIAVAETPLTTAWADYSTTSTITGWSAYTAKAIKYSRVGNFVYVLFNISGTSNSTSASFTLPYAASDLTPMIYRAQDNGGSFVSGYGRVLGASSDMGLFSTVAGGSWTSSGTKSVAGQFWYAV